MVLVTNRYIWHCFTGKQQPTSFRCLACVLITALCSLNKRCLAMENTAKGLETKKYITIFPKVNFEARLACWCGCIPYWFCCSNQKFNAKRFRKSGKVFGNYPNTSRLWRWLPHRLSKRQSLSTTTVLFRTTFTRTIKLNLFLKWLLGSNLSHISFCFCH